MRILAALLLLATCVVADYEETEHRLKTAGVGDAQRKRIHDAIDKAVAFLLREQRQDGSWAAQRPVRMKELHPREAETVFASLALRHAGTPQAKRGADRGLAWLVPADSKGRKNLYRHVYVAGPMIMLLQASRKHDDVALGIAAAIAKGQDKRSGWWGYRTGTTLGTEEQLDGRYSVNLSTTQFAALGVWAGDRVRGRADVGVWTKHLEGLVGTQSRSGSWAYGAVATPSDRVTYPCGTFMGVANLQLALAGTGKALALQPNLEAKAIDAKQRAMMKLAEHGPKFLRDLQLMPTRSGRGSGAFRYYTLYALEKACVFADVEEIGGVRWYAEGADQLCSEQRPDGSWSEGLPKEVSTGPTITTCFALLFLLRTSHAYHPTTPRGVDLNPGTTTGQPGPDGKKPEPQPVAPEKPPVARTDAFDLLAELRKALSSPTAEGLPEVERLLLIGEFWKRVVPDARAEWRAEATKLLLQLFGARPRPVRDYAPKWDALQVAGAGLLATARPPADDVWRGLDAGPLRAKPKNWAPSELYWKASLAELLPALGGDASAMRLYEDVVDLDERYRARTLAALRGLRAYQDLSGRTRFELSRELVKRFGGLENATGDSGKGRAQALERWGAYSMDVLATLRALTRDPRSGKFAKDKNGQPPRTLAAYRRWLSDHKRLTSPPWLAR